MRVDGLFGVPEDDVQDQVRVNDRTVCDGQLPNERAKKRTPRGRPGRGRRVGPVCCEDGIKRANRGLQVAPCRPFPPPARSAVALTRAVLYSWDGPTAAEESTA